MKSILQLFFISTLILSCSFNQKKQEQEKVKADSILQVQQVEREKFVVDSIEKAARIQLSITAFRDLKFEFP